MASHDLKRILAGWPYEPGQITVRKVMGDDGHIKIQMRLDLGLLQMEYEGRPDGERPHGAESLLEHHKQGLSEHTRRSGTDLGFELSADDCQALRDEAVMYYHRYLSLFVLEEFEGVERDTRRNLEVLDFCRKYAAEEDDRLALEQYRCYLIMMNTRAKAHRAIEQNAYKTALAYVEAGLHEMEEHLESVERAEDEADEPGEVTILRALRSEILERVPADPVSSIEEQLASAINEERYEEAAVLRDRLAAIRRQRRGRRSDAEPDRGRKRKRTL